MVSKIVLRTKLPAIEMIILTNLLPPEKPTTVNKVGQSCLFVALSKFSPLHILKNLVGTI